MKGEHKADFVVTVRVPGHPERNATAVIKIDPQDIYQPALDADLRALAWQALGYHPEDRLNDDIQPRVLVFND